MIERPCFIYVMEAAVCFHGYDDKRLFKVGIADNPILRLTQLTTSCPYPLSIRTMLRMPRREDALYAERETHKWLRKARTRGEWFATTFDRVWHAVACNAICVWANDQPNRITIADFMRFSGFPEDEIAHAEGL